MPVRKAPVKRAPKVIAEFATYIDPLNCDSTISYKIINGPRRVWGDVQLASCTHKIDWYFGYDTSPEKINRVISAMESFRDALAAAHAKRPKRVVKRKAKT